MVAKLGKTRTQVARDLDLNESMLGKWVANSDPVRVPCNKFLDASETFRSSSIRFCFSRTTQC